MEAPDRAIRLIAQARGLDFRWFRSSLMANHDLKDSLASGHAVLDSVAQLDQYLYTHGLMIESQWKKVSHIVRGIDRPALIIDYGCGQGLAGLLINDLTQGQLLKPVLDTFLIEPSPLALARAAAVYGRVCPSARISKLCKRFDALSSTDINSTHSGLTLHVFSNSLDVRGFDPVQLLRKTLRPGRHAIISVSHDRSFNGGTPQIEFVKASIGRSANFPTVNVMRSTLERFTCDNPSQSKGGSLVLRVGESE